jgi:uncharacterized protein
LTKAHRPPAWIAWWSVGALSARIIMVWLYDRTAEAYLVWVVFHPVSNVCWQLFPVQGSFLDPRVNALVLALVAAVVILCGSLRTDYRLS